MSVDILLQTEFGDHIEEICDETGAFTRLLPELEDESFLCLRFIDVYGDTIFNHLQIPSLLQDLEHLNKIATTPEELEILSKIKTLANKCVSDRLYLNFIGD